MFVMLSVRTSTTVRERQTETVVKKVNNNNINSIVTSYNNHTNNNNNNRLPNQNQIDKTYKTLSPTISVEKDTTTIIITEKQQSPPPRSKSNLSLTELNNYKTPATVQVPVATILNDLSPVPAPVKVKNKENPTTFLSPMTPAGLQNNTPDVKAMRYYRLWIYTCNAVLLMAVIVFCGVAGKVLLADYRRLLVNGMSLAQPSFIYAYLALLVQSGFLQTIGCLGALRLSEKLLNAYWLLLLVLLMGDAILGIFWMFKFDRIMHDLQPMLRFRLAHEYGVSSEFTELWDRLQNEGRCCGVTGPQDFTANANRSYPTSCCTSDITEQISISKRPFASAVVFRNDDLTIQSLKDQQQKNLTEITDLTWNHVVMAAKGGESKTIAACRAVYPQGCIDKVVIWLRHTADILFVLGYCVIAFCKLCFLGILRYEIKEMIQKIKLLQTEMASAILNGEYVDAATLQQQNSETFSLLKVPNVNGGLHNAPNEPKVGNRDRERTRVGSESERESLLLQENTPKALKHKQLYQCSAINEHTATGGGGGVVVGDSDTNSNCALIVDNIAATTTIATATSAARTINGNNNYELSEFDHSKAQTYNRLLNAPTVTKI